MVQDQLVEYISSQLKLSVSRDAVKTALVGAGWAAADVEDTLKKIEGAGKSSSPSASAAPVSAASASSSSGPASTSRPTFATSLPNTSSGGSIRVSDLISTNPSISKSSAPATPSSASTTTSRPAASGGAMAAMAAAAKPQGGKTGLIIKIVGIALIVGFGGIAGYLYMQNASLAGKISSLGGVSAGVSSQVASLSGQVQALTASNTALMAQVASSAAENLALRTNLSFTAVPSSASATSSPETVSVSGKLMVKQTSYLLETDYGVLIFVQNGKDAKVAAALKALMAATSTAPVVLSGSHVPGSPYLTVTAVNGTAVQ